MSLTALDNTPGTVESVIKDVNYVDDPLGAYHCLKTNNSVLLESAEIDSKDSLQSLILLDAAVRIECNDQTVQVQALSKNGQAALNLLEQALPEQLKSKSDSLYVFEFEKPPKNIDEDTRLKMLGVLDVLRTIRENVTSLRDHPHSVFLAGVFGYDLVACYESLPPVPVKDNCCPDYVFYLAESLVLIDHQLKSTQILGSVFSGPHLSEEYFRVHQRIEHIAEQLQTVNFAIDSTNTHSIHTAVDKTDSEFCSIVDDLKENILDGDIFQVVPSRTFSMKCDNALLAYQRLKQTNPSPYMFYIVDRDFEIFGASPESALKYSQASNIVEIYPIAGTRPRGKLEDGSIDHDLDSRLELDLRLDKKEQAEHIMLVDLARNDVARVTTPGTRFVKDLLKVDRYSHVMHLVSRVIGQLKPDLDALHAYQACMNMGTLVGAPKLSAASLIRQVEKKKRGSYGGAVGYLNGKGDFDTCIVIRSAFVKDDIAYIQAGAGIVRDSLPQSEADETRAKAQAVITAISTASESVQLAQPSEDGGFECE
ncbi:MAG: anthranilate synthase component 1 [Pseudomonadota bacterium]